MLQNEIKKQIEEIMMRHFDDIIDKEAPKQPNGSSERKLALMIGSHIIAKSIPNIVTLIQDREKKALKEYTEWLRWHTSAGSASAVPVENPVIWLKQYLGSVKS